jgi:hypothetical protein
MEGDHEPHLRDPGAHPAGLAAVAQPGERRIYCTGFLARSSGMAALASVAMELQEAGVVHPFQQRVDEDVYAYIAQRRR